MILAVSLLLYRSKDYRLTGIQSCAHIGPLLAIFCPLPDFYHHFVSLGKLILSALSSFAFPHHPSRGPVYFETPCKPFVLAHLAYPGQTGSCFLPASPTGQRLPYHCLSPLTSPPASPLEFFRFNTLCLCRSTLSILSLILLAAWPCTVHHVLVLTLSTPHLFGDDYASCWKPLHIAPATHYLSARSVRRPSAGGACPPRHLPPYWPLCYGLSGS